MTHSIEPHSLLTQVHELYNGRNSHDAIDMLYNIVDIGSFAYMSEVCRAATERVEELPIGVLITLLTITHSCKDKVMLRDWLFAATMARIVERTPNKVRALLDGLEGTDVNPW